MDLLKFMEWLEARNYGFPLSLLLLPDNPDRAIAFAAEEGVGSKGTVTDLVLNFYVRAEHPAEALKVGTKINKDLDLLTKVFIEETQIILIKSNMRVPLPIGVDANDRHHFHVQFKMLVSPTDKLNIRD